jgi:hypothetical protein
MPFKAQVCLTLDDLRPKLFELNRCSNRKPFGIDRTIENSCIGQYIL